MANSSTHGPEVGRGYVTVMPDMSKFQAAVSSSLNGSDPFAALDNKASQHGSSAGQKAGQSFRASVLSLAGDLGNAGRQLGNALANSLVGQAAQKIGTGLASACRSSVLSAGKLLGVNIGSGITDGLSTAKIAIGTVIGNIISGIASTVSGSVSSAISRLDTIRNFPKIMSGMGIEGDTAAASIDKLDKSIDGLPTRLDDIVSFTQKIVPGLNMDLDNATDSAIAFNNALVAGGKDATLQANALEQWSQMLGVGKVDMQAWRSVVNAMPAQMQQLAESMGFASSIDLYSNLVGSKEGTIPLTEMNEALKKLNEEGFAGYASFAEQAKTASDSLGTAITNLHNRVDKAIYKILDWIGQGTISGWINNFSSSFGPTAVKFTEWLDSIDARAGIGTIFTTIGEGLTAVGATIQPLVDRITPLAVAIMPVLNAAFGQLFTAMAEYGAPVVDSLAQKLDSVIFMLPGLTPALNDFIAAAVSLGTATIETAADMWGRIAAAMLPVADDILANYETVVKTVGEFIASAVEIIAPYLPTIMETISVIVASFAPAILDLMEKVSPWIDPLCQFIQTAASFVADHLEGFLAIAAGVKLISDAFALISGFSNVIGIIRDVQDAFEGVSSALSFGASALGGGISNLGGVAAALASPVGVVAGIALAAAAALWFFNCTDTGKQLWSDFEGFMGGVFSKLQSDFANLGAAWQQGWSDLTATLSQKWENFKAGWDEKTAEIRAKWDGFISGAQASWNETVANLEANWGNFTSDWLAKNEEIREAFSTLVSDLGAKWDNATSSLKNAWDDAGDWLEDRWDDFLNWFDRSAPNFDIFDGLTDAFESALGWIEDRWNDFTSWFDFDFSPAYSPSYGSYDYYDYAFADGGIATKPTKALIAEKGTPEAVVPLSAQGIREFTRGIGLTNKGGGGGVTVVIQNFNNYDTTHDVADLSDRIGREARRQLKAQGVI